MIQRLHNQSHPSTGGVQSVCAFSSRAALGGWRKTGVARESAGSAVWRECERGGTGQPLPQRRSVRGECEEEKRGGRCAERGGQGQRSACVCQSIRQIACDDDAGHGRHRLGMAARHIASWADCLLRQFICFSAHTKRVTACGELRLHEACRPGELETDASATLMQRRPRGAADDWRR